MSTPTVTTLAFVRTASGVVRVDQGGPVPADALETEVERLVNAGVITTGEPAGDQGSGEVPGEGGDPAPAGDDQPPRRGRGKPGA